MVVKKEFPISGMSDSSIRPCQRNPEGFVFQELDGEAVLYDPATGAIHRFNEQSKFIWDLCNGINTIENMAHLLAEKYAIEHNEAITHVIQFIKDLQVRNLLSQPCIGDADTGPTDLQHLGNPDDQLRTRRYSRRELIRGGATKLIFTAPLISTFFATGAYASGVGSADCKPPGYSCSVVGDCCNDALRNCDANVCCITTNNAGCTVDADCCNPNTCQGGTCLP